MKALGIVIFTAILSLHSLVVAKAGGSPLKELSENETVTQEEFNAFTQNLTPRSLQAPVINDKFVTFKSPGVKTTGDHPFFRDLLKGSEVGFCKLQGMKYVSSKSVWPDSIYHTPVRLDQSGRFSEVAELLTEITCRIP